MIGISLALAATSLALAMVHRTRAVALRGQLEALRAAGATAPTEAAGEPVAPGPLTPVLPDPQSAGDKALIATLEARLAEREAEIAALRAAAIRPLPEVLVTEAVPVATNTPRRSWLEELQTSDPQRYQEIMVRREQARQEARYDIAKKASYFLQNPTDGMTEAEAEAYARMMDLLTESLKLTERLDAGLPQEQRRELVGDLRDNMRELSPLLEKERDKEFFQVGKDLGYTDADAQAFADYLVEVVDLTSVNRIFRNAMRGMGGGWGGGPPPAGGTDR
jgi:hypothetical protein